MRESSSKFIKHSHTPKYKRGGEKKVMKKVLSLILAVALVSTAFAGVAGAASLESTAKFYILKQKGIFTGLEDGSPGLDQEMTRAQAAVIVKRLLKLSDNFVAASAYTDLDSAEWAAGAIGAVTPKYMQGVGAGKFDPAGKFTLEQLATVMVRLVNLQINSNATIPGASEWGAPYVVAALQAGMIQGASDYSVPATRETLVNATYEVDRVIIDMTVAPVVNADGTVRIAGTSESSSVLVKVFAGGNTSAVAFEREVAVANGSFTVTTPALPAGTHTAHVSSAGYSAQAPFTVADSAVTATATAKDDNTVTVAGTTNRASVNVKIFANGDKTAKAAVDQNVNATGSNYTFTSPVLPAGKHLAVVTVGTKEASAEFTIIPLQDIASAKKVGAAKYEVKMNRAVDTTKAVVQIKQGAAIFTSTAVWNAAKDTATVTTLVDLNVGDYSAVVTGLDKEYSKTFNAGAAVATTLSITTTQVDVGLQNARVAFKVSNQFGEDLNLNANTAGIVLNAYNVTKSKDVVVAQAGGNKYFEINTTAGGGTNFAAGDVIRTTLTYQGMTVQVNITLTAPSALSTFELGAIALAANDTLLNASDNSVKLGYKLLDQYGAAKKLTTTQATALPATIDGIQFISSSNIIDTIEVNANGEIVLSKAGGPLGTGSTTITTVWNAKGTVSSAAITVSADPAPKTATIAAPTALVAAGDAAFDLAVTVVDQYGGAVTSANSVTAVVTGVANGTATVSATNSVLKVAVNLANVTVNAPTSTKVEIKTGATTIGSVTFMLQPNAAPSYVSAVKFGPVFEVGGTATLVPANVTAIDQYGRTVSGATVTLTKTTDANNTVFSAVNQNAVTGAAAGSATFSVTATKNGVTSTAQTITLSTVATADVKTYSIAEIKPIFKEANAAYHATPVLIGMTAAGADVVLAAGKITGLTSSNTAIAKITNGKIEGVAAGTAVISAYQGATKLADVTVTVTTAASAPASIKFVSNTISLSNANNLAAILEIKDQYGVVITPALQIISSDTNVVAANGAINQGTATVVVVTANGLQATATVLVNQ